MLENVRIIDLTHRLAGPSATALLSQMGAEVIKVESPEGDLARQSEPAVRPEVSEYFAIVNQSKQFVCIDLKNPDGHAAFLRLIANADGLLDNYRPGVLDRLGLSDDVLLAANPRLTHVSLSGHGSDGPYRDRPSVDVLIQSLTGLMTATGEPDGPPVPAGMPLADVLAGLYGAVALVSGILANGRGRTKPTVASVSMQQSMLYAMAIWSVRWLNGGEPPQRLGSGNPYVVPYGLYPTADGWITVAARGEGFWREIATRMGRGDLPQDERFATNERRIANRETLDAILAETLKSKPTQAWLDVFGDLPVAPVNDIPAAFADPHVLATQGIAQFRAGEQTGVLRAAATPIRWRKEKTDVELPRRLGADTAAVLARVAGCSSAEIDALIARGAVRQAEL